MRALVTPVAWARVLNARVLMVDYRLAPMTAKPPTGGDSAGGNLTNRHR